jgi:hypothetical protein
MAINDEKAEAIRTSHHVSEPSNRLEEKDVENPTASYLPQSDGEYVVTFKTWCVVVVSRTSSSRSSSPAYRISRFWLSHTVLVFGSSHRSAHAVLLLRLSWVIRRKRRGMYTITVTIAFMVCGANSDLFGRRWFIVGGNAILFVGFIVGGTAKNNTSMLVAMSLIGFVRHPRLVRLRFADYKCRVPVMRRSVYMGDLEHIFND